MLDAPDYDLEFSAWRLFIRRAVTPIALEFARRGATPYCCRLNGAAVRISFGSDQASARPRSDHTGRSRVASASRPDRQLRRLVTPTALIRRIAGGSRRRDSQSSSSCRSSTSQQSTSDAPAVRLGRLPAPFDMSEHALNKGPARRSKRDSLKSNSLPRLNSR